MMDVLSRAKEGSPPWLRGVADRSTRQYGLLTSRRRTPPDYVIVGSKRGGTTSLYNYLLRHPGVLRMFPSSRDLKSTDFFFRHPESDAAWYLSHFPTRSQRFRSASSLGYAPVCGEASPYYIWDPRVAPRMRVLVPDVKAIMLVRNPVRRAWSHYQERVQNGVEPLTFRQALDAEEGRLSGELARMLADPSYYSAAHDWYSYRSRGEYAPQIRGWLEHFPTSQLLVLRSEDLYSRTQETFDAVCSFLGIPPMEMPTRKQFNATWRTTDEVPEAEGVELASHYQTFNQDLGLLLGRDIAW